MKQNPIFVCRHKSPAKYILSSNPGHTWMEIEKELVGIILNMNLQSAYNLICI